MIRWRSSLFGGALLAALLSGCARESERPDAPPDSSAALAPTPDALGDGVAPTPAVNPFAETARRALRIELGLDDYRTVDGTWAAGDASSTFTAHFSGDTLRLIEEKLSAGDDGTETSVYYFAGDALFYAVQDAVRLRAEAGAQPDTVQLRVALTPSGDLLAAEGTVNGEPEPVDRVLVEGVRRHAEALRERATVTRPAL